MMVTQIRDVTGSGERELDTLTEGRGRGGRTVPALDVERRRKGGYKDEFELGITNRVNSIIISDMGL